MKENEADTKKTLQEAIVETYFRHLEEPLHGSLRFIFATLGALSLLIATTILDNDLEERLYILELGPEFPALISLGASAFYGFIIALPETHHGPVRLYLSGLLLPAIVAGVIRYTF